ncbi:hypothetical protein CYMTET_49636 [Cymbomonas tetramitiformis]|uniref:Succinate dehydrogenase [ubiquinone] cytochrome b small subunit n=1 Tax=Cymbomonas tetramitiformis TaxID=36881 RepID=A0AAE0BQY1_9CHLO|nr:hypothetical protein CYMTET_49636 [Cymbomonas tetramitiformis]
MASKLINADLIPASFYHKTSIAAGVLLPLGVFTEGSLSLPFDLLLGVALPVHSHIACNYVIADYIKPPALNGAARAGMMAVTAVTLAGLLKLNLTGPGLSASVKQLWKKSE